MLVACVTVGRISCKLLTHFSEILGGVVGCWNEKFFKVVHVPYSGWLEVGKWCANSLDGSPSVDCEQLSCLIRSCPVSKEMAVNCEEEQGIQSLQSIASHIGSVSWACTEQH